MTGFQLSEREELLLKAALNPSVAIARQSWENWASQGAIENAPHHELRLLPAVYAHLSSIAPTFRLPSKLRGKAKAIFTRSNLLASATLPMINELGRHSPVMLTKGLAMCIRFGTWSSRPMADVDIHVPFRSLETVCASLANSGWTPRYGMTLQSLIHRTSLHRDSWNFTKGAADIDLHWRPRTGPEENWLTKEMWQSGERFEFRGQSLLLQSPEFALVSSLWHGVVQGDRGDALQTIVDAVLLLPVCRSDRLAILLEKSDLLGPFRELMLILERVGARAILPKFAFETAGTYEPAPGKWRYKPKTERSLLRRPLLYKLWNLLGKKSSLERLILRTSGPFSKPLSGKAPVRSDYDLSDCGTLDEVGGPGWSWPHSGCFWSNGFDARLLIPLQHVGDYLVLLGLGGNLSPDSRFYVFANGYPVTRINFSKVHAADYCLIIPRNLLFGPWIELSLRPQPAGREDIHAFSVPARRLRVLDLNRVIDVHEMAEFCGLEKPKSLYLKILNGNEPEASKFARIKQRIETSAHRASPDLPHDFDPIAYVISYPDLFEHEVDPYEHYISSGRREGRFYRFV